SLIQPSSSSVFHSIPFFEQTTAEHENETTRAHIFGGNNGTTEWFRARQFLTGASHGLLGARRARGRSLLPPAQICHRHAIARRTCRRPSIKNPGRKAGGSPGRTEPF